MKQKVLNVCSDVGCKLKKLFRAAYEWWHKSYSGRAVANAVSKFRNDHIVPQWVVDYIGGDHHLSLQKA